MFVNAAGIVAVVLVTQAPAAVEQHRAAVKSFNEARRIASPDRVRRDAIAKGIAAEERALTIDPEFLDALVYQYLLLRMQAADAPSPTERVESLKQADAVERRVRALKPGPYSGRVVKIDSVDVSARIPRDFKAVVDELHPVHVGGSVRMPTVIRNVRPILPPFASITRIQGVVWVEIVIGPSGDVRAARVVRSIPVLDEAALEGVRQWRFAPVLVNGAPGAVFMTVPQNYTPH